MNVVDYGLSVLVYLVYNIIKVPISQTVASSKIVLIIAVFVVSFAGCIGALRENTCLLKFYSLSLLVFFLGEMTLLALGFIYPHKFSEFLEEKLSQKLIESYRDDLDFQNLIDLIQKDFQCCGISSQGYKDWSNNEYFNCTKDPKVRLL